MPPAQITYSVVPPPMSMTRAPSSFCSLLNRARAEASPLKTMSSTSNWRLFTARIGFCSRLKLPWTTWTSTSTLAPSIPTGFWMPSWPSTRKCWRMTCTTWFSAGRLMALAFLTASCTSSSLISRSAETTGCTPRLLNPRKCPPLTPRYTLRTSTSAICSASTTALRMSSVPMAASVISPLRTPRERA